jgi:hypothetical protein
MRRPSVVAAPLPFSRSSLLAVFALLALLPAPAFAQAQCGGVERWPVKVGSDPDAASVDTNPTTATLHDLVRLPTPSLPHDDETRAPEERTVAPRSRIPWKSSKGDTQNG